VTLALGDVARAEDPALPTLDPDGKAASSNEPAEAQVEAPTDIDLANVVTATAKSVTTVQEVPAIVTVLTAEDIRRRGVRTLDEALSNIPGWMTGTLYSGAIQLPTVRGVQLAALLLHDGVSMFDPWQNWPSFNTSLPLETLKRIEVVTGPGGVLWGANSFLGIINLISKDADDVNGLEASASYGDGPGNRQDFRGYAMFGKSFFGGKLKIFQHLSYESYLGPQWSLPKLIQTSPWVFGPDITPNQMRSWIVTIDGKYSVGPFSLYYSVPFAQMYSEQSLTTSPDGRHNFTIFDRYGILEYRQRFLGSRLGVTARGSYVQFQRSVQDYLYPESAILPVGLPIAATTALVQRYGGTVDVDIALPRQFRMLAGFETFNESVSNTSLTVQVPSSTGYLGFVCALNPDGSQVKDCPQTITRDVNRIVVAGYLDAQWRPVHPLILDGGVRLQQGFGPRPYALTPLYSAAAAWNFYRGFHLKANYATGFRPPSFNNTDSTGAGVNWVPNPRLLNERSQSFQGEFNARLARNLGIFREAELRLDYAYTLLENLISFSGPVYANVYDNNGRRSIHSAEALLRAYLVGDHFVEVGYTYLYSVSSLIGVERNAPSQWFTLTTSFNLVKQLLDFNATLRVYTSTLDVNRYASGTSGGVPGSTSSAIGPNATIDTLSPFAVLQLGLHVRLFHDRLIGSVQVYNALNQHYYLPDVINEQRPNSNSLPTPAPGISAFGTLTYRVF
jgi:iron complex outermembrane receptor protein